MKNIDKLRPSTNVEDRRGKTDLKATMIGLANSSRDRTNAVLERDKSSTSDILKGRGTAEEPNLDFNNNRRWRGGK